MKIDCYISQGCGSEGALKENIDRALEAEKIQAEVGIHRISDEKAAALKLSGSPSVFITARNCSHRAPSGFPEGCSRTSRADSQMYRQWIRYARL